MDLQTTNTSVPQRKEFQSIPLCTFASLTIIFVVGIGSTVVLLANKYSETSNDAYKVFSEGEIYRLMTSMFSINDLQDLFVMISCFIWLPFVLQNYQRRFGTLYVLYHYLRSYIIISLFVNFFYEYMFLMIGMKNFNQSSAGILPYCLYMYLKKALQNPNQIVDYWYFPITMKRWVAGLVMAIILTWFSPENSACLIIFLLFILNMLGNIVLFLIRCRDRVTSYQGPWCCYLFRIIQKIIPGCIKNLDNFYVLKTGNEEEDIELSNMKQDETNQQF